MHAARGFVPRQLLGESQLDFRETGHPLARRKFRHDRAIRGFDLAEELGHLRFVHSRQEHVDRFRITEHGPAAEVLVDRHGRAGEDGQQVQSVPDEPWQEIIRPDEVDGRDQNQ